MKYTDKQIAEMFIQSLEEAKETVQKNGKISDKINQDLKNFEKDFFLKLNKAHLTIDDKQAKETIEFFNRTHQNASKGVELTRFAYGLIFISIIVLGINTYLFYLNIQSKEEIREDYKNELIEKGQYNSKDDSEYLKKFRHWISKNPKDSKILNNAIESEWNKK